MSKFHSIGTAGESIRAGQKIRRAADGRHYAAPITTSLADLAVQAAMTGQPVIYLTPDQAAEFRSAARSRYTAAASGDGGSVRGTVSQADWEYQGVFKVPATVNFGGSYGVQSTSYGKGAIAARKVGAAARVILTANFGGSFFEVAVPVTLGADLAGAPTAAVTNTWEDGTGSFYGTYAPASGAGPQYIWAASWFGGDAHLPAGVLWSIGLFYGGDVDCPSLGLTAISGSTATPFGNWKIAGYGRGYRQGGSMVMPDGRICMTGGGGFSGIGDGFSHGPSAFALTTTNMAAATPTTTSPANGTNTPFAKLLNYSPSALYVPPSPYLSPKPAVRDNSYRLAVFGLVDRAALSPTQVYVPSGNFSDYAASGIGRSMTCRGETRGPITAWDGVNSMYTLASGFSFTPQIGDDIEIALDDGTQASIAVWLPQGATGYMSQVDSVGSPVWIDGPNKTAALYPMRLGKGRIHYQGGSYHLESREYQAWAYRPSDLNGSDDIAPVNRIDLAALIPGLPTADTYYNSGWTGREINFALDPTDYGSYRIVYVLLNFAWTSGVEDIPAVYVFKVHC